MIRLVHRFDTSHGDMAPLIGRKEPSKFPPSWHSLFIDVIPNFLCKKHQHDAGGRMKDKHQPLLAHPASRKPQYLHGAPW